MKVRNFKSIITNQVEQILNTVFIFHFVFKRMCWYAWTNIIARGIITSSMNYTIINHQEYNIQQISASYMVHKQNQANQSMFSRYHFFWAACKASTARRSGNTRRRWWITTLYRHCLFVLRASWTLTFWEEIKNRHISALFWGVRRLKTKTRLATRRIVWRTISISSRSLASWISSIHLGILRVGPCITLWALFQFQKGGFYNNYNIKK